MNITRTVGMASSKEKSNFHHLVMDVVWFGLAISAIDRFREVYAIRLGADTTQLTLLASLPSLVLFVTSSVANRWLKRYASSKDAIKFPGLIFRLAFILPALTAFFPPELRLPWLILSVLLPAIGQGIAAVGFIVMFREAVSGSLVASLHTRRMMVINITVAISGLTMGFWLERAPFPFNYQMVFVVGFILSLISWRHVTKVEPLPELVTPPPAEPTQRVNPWRYPTFQVVAFIIVLCFMTFTSIKPMQSLYMVNVLHADEWFLSLFGLVELASGAFVALFTARVIARFGNRTMIAYGLIGTGIAAFIIASAQSLPITLLSAAIGGSAWTIVNIGQFAYFSEMTPHEHKEPFTTAYHQTVFMATFIGPIIGKLLTTGDLPMVSVLVIGAILRVTAGIMTQMHARTWYARVQKFGYSRR
ncbi:MAG: MFS transporter [Chloroflexi bacterium]|nr:MFS transporter [Chloroflexota bacterium]MCC6892436.1 MFS transporter [Anaerolineae bacterium]